MATRLGEWWPDTCQCHLLYTFDTEQVGRLAIQEVLVACVAHEGLPKEEVWRQVRAENIVKNASLEIIHAVVRRLVVTTQTPDGPVERDADHIRWEWGFVPEPGPERRRRISIYLRGDTLMGFERNEIMRLISEANLPIPVSLG